MKSICPILSNARIEQGMRPELIPVDCREEVCAWWQQATQSCSITMAAAALFGIEDAAEGIESALTIANMRGMCRTKTHSSGGSK